MLSHGEKYMGKLKVQSLERAFAILALFRQKRPPEMTVKEIGEAVDLSKATLYRFLADLEAAGYLEYEPMTRKYKLGLMLLELGMIVRDSLDLRKKALPYMESLRSRTDENVNLGVIDNDEVIYIERLESTGSLQFNFRVGSRFALNSSSVGKLLLAYMTEEERNAVINRLTMTRYTAHSIINKDKLLAELKVIRNRKFAISNREFHEDIAAVAVPVYNHLGEAIAGINLLAPVSRMTEEIVNSDYLPLLWEAAENISRSMGYTGTY